MISFTPLNSFLLGDRRAGLLRLTLLVVLPLGVFVYQLYSWFMTGSSFQLGWFILIYFLGLFGAFSTAVYYLKDIYNEAFDALPARYLFSSFFGLFPPKVQVNAREERSVYNHMVDVIGGPVYLEVDPGWVVLTESLSAPGKIYGHGKKHFMPRRERIAEVVNLHEQEAKHPTISAFTRDGIKVLVEDVKFNYRIFDSRWSIHKNEPLTLTRKPYPYSKEAVYYYAYKRSVVLNGESKPELTEWKKAIALKVSGIITDFISEHKLDEIIAPRGSDNQPVRETIRKMGYEESFTEGLRGLGSMLTWWDPGEFHTEEKDVQKQFVANWSADIQSEIKINEAHGEAQRIAYEELGRAEAEAELLMSIIHALEGIKLGKDKVQTLQNLILLRTAQVIKALGYNAPPTTPQKKSE
jgi:hypothetical protein